MQASLPPATVTFWQALGFWLKLGFISFGGPAGQIAVMHQELVERKRWISEGRFLHALNFCMLLPGPEAQQLATYLGWLMHKTWGGLAAGLLFILPSLALLIGLSWGYCVFGQVPWVAAIFYGIKPAVAALVVQAAWRIGNRTLKHPLLWALAAASFTVLTLVHAPFPLIILVAAGLGLLLAQFFPKAFSHNTAHSTKTKAETFAEPAWINDATPIPAYGIFKVGRFIATLAIGLFLWLAPIVLLLALQGWNGTLTEMALFFTKAALLTVGGAYAVLPYVHQAAVGHFGWLSSSQMMDGLALGESTPGPLIMVVVFVAFLGGFQQPFLGEASALSSALWASVCVTWFTFLPSFIFIFAGAPWIESTKGQLRFNAPLTAITAAIVGAIGHLAVFFITAAVWSQTHHTIDLPALAIALAAGVALIRYKVSILWVVAISGLLGVIIQRV